MKIDDAFITEILNTIRAMPIPEHLEESMDDGTRKFYVELREETIRQFEHRMNFPFKGNVLELISSALNVHGTMSPEYGSLHHTYLIYSEVLYMLSKHLNGDKNDGIE